MPAKPHLCIGGCGNPVSANKQRCYDCIAEEARANVRLMDKEPMENATHILLKRDGTRPDSGASYKGEDLHRVDGMLVASRQDDVVRYGDDISTARNHIFIDAESAAAWLRRLADVDLVAQQRGEPLMPNVYRYTSEELAPRAARIDERIGDEIEVETVNGRRVLLATPGQIKSVKTH